MDDVDEADDVEDVEEERLCPDEVGGMRSGMVVSNWMVMVPVMIFW